MSNALDITTEINEENFRLIIKNYYLNRNWEKRIAILAIISLVWSIYTIWGNHFYTNLAWNCFSFFNALFFFLMLFFFALPYLVWHTQMNQILKKEDIMTGTYAYSLAIDGINVKINDLDKSYKWNMVTKVHSTSEFTVLKMNNSDLLIIPVIALDEDLYRNFLTLARTNAPNAKWKILKAK